LGNKIPNACIADRLYRCLFFREKSSSEMRTYSLTRQVFKVRLAHYAIRPRKVSRRRGSYGTFVFDIGGSLSASALVLTRHFHSSISAHSSLSLHLPAPCQQSPEPEDKTGAELCFRTSIPNAKQRTAFFTTPFSVENLRTGEADQRR
jgi:hypothetical protein